MKSLKLVVFLGLSALCMQAFADSSELEKTVIKSQKEREIDTDLIDATEIDRSGINSIEDLVKHIPGVQVNDTSDRFHASGFNIRGVEGDDVAITVDGIPQGEALSPPSFAPYGAFGSNRNIVDVETVKQIKITKGPDSVLAGSGALGGSVAFTTKDAGDFLDAETGDESGFKFKSGYDARSDQVLVTGALANRTGGLESLLIYVNRDRNETESHDTSGGGLGSGRTVADPFDIDQASILAKLTYSLSDRHSLGLVYEDFDRDTKGRPLSRDHRTYYDFETDDTSERERYGIFYDFTDADAGFFDSLSATLDWQELFNHGIMAFAFNSGRGGDATTRDDDILRMEDRNHDQETFDARVDFEKVFGANDGHRLVYGFSYSDYSVSNELFDRRFASVEPGAPQTQNLRDPSWVPETDKRQYSAYILDEFALNEMVAFTVGIRYDDTEYEPDVDENFVDPLGVSVKDSDFSAFAGQAGVTFTFAEHHSIGLLYAQGYKAPTVQELYLDVEAVADGIVDAVTGETFDDWEEIANPGLDAEEAESFEVSYTWESPRVYVKVNAFVTDYKDQIQSVTQTRPLGKPVELELPCSPFAGCDPANPPPNIFITEDEYNQARNVGKTEVKGLEFESGVYITDTLLLTLTASRLDGRHKTALDGRHDKGDELVTVSPDSATLGISYDAPNDKWGLSADYTWTDRKDESEDLSFTSLNNSNGPVVYSNTSWVLDLAAFYNITENFSLTMNAHNLTDEKYLRWEVINGIRPGGGGFFRGSTVEGADRYTEPGRSYSVYASYSF